MNPDQKHCPICEKDLPISEFGICRARKDGRNLYCKEDIRKKVAQSRRALKEYKQARRRFIESQVEIAGMAFEDGSVQSLSKLSPVERVREAIRIGKRTQKEIAQETKLGKDEIGDAIANLLLWTKEIRTEVVEGTRMYFLIKVEQLERKPNVISPSLWTVANQVGPVVKGERRVRAVA